jgi:hypothetical protein
MLHMTARRLVLTALCVSALALPANASGLLDSITGAVGGALGGSSQSGSLSNETIADGLLEALRVGTERVVSQVGAVDGFNADPDIHIPLPENLRSVQKALRTVGMGQMADDVELKLNRAAEAAAPEAKEVFWTTIRDMSFEDARAIYEGPDDSATRYFEQKMTPELTTRMTPIVEDSLAEVGAVRAYDAMMGRYADIPFVPDVKADLTAHAVREAINGIFHYVAVEEAAIRNDPAARTTDLLKTVFGN